MKDFRQINLLCKLAFIVIFLVSWFVMFYTIKSIDTPYIAMVAAVLALVLSPRVKKYETQSGTQAQLKWLFLKKVIDL